MNIFLLGKNGQVAFELNKKLVSYGNVFTIGQKELNFNNNQSIAKWIDNVRPDLIINAAAYTQVDKAEREPKLAYQINAAIPEFLTEKACDLNIPIIHFSTDYVFDGFKNELYTEEDKPNPQSVYAKTKWSGEEAVRQYQKHIILRTSRIFGSHGHNFLKTILKHIQKKDYLTIVADYKIKPTSTLTLANTISKITQSLINDSSFNNFGTYHVTSEGETDLYEFTSLIINEAIQLGFPSMIKTSDIKLISRFEYFSEALRPLNSRLSSEKIKKTFFLELPFWHDEIKKTLRSLINNHAN
jgi:dTDP-4-dehydrorhamnose reductase